MLPECRLSEYLSEIPPFAIEKDNFGDFADDFRNYHEKFSTGFARSEPRGHFFDYMAGQLRAYPKTLIEFNTMKKQEK